MSLIHIPPLAAETLFRAGKIPVTNAIVNTWIAIIIFLIIGWRIRRRVHLRPGKLQNFWEYILELLMGYFDQVTGERKKTIRFLPIVGSIFFFILLSNWLGLLPGTGSLLWRHEPLLRPANTDLNLTVAMAVVAVIASHLYGLFSIGIAAHFNKFIQLSAFFKSLRRGPVAIFTAIIELAVGLIELVSEFAKVLSLSLRLFGNIFAGEVLMTVMLGLAAAVVPAPFMLLELLVGIIQASVFAMLTLVYMTVASAEPHGAEH